MNVKLAATTVLAVTTITLAGAAFGATLAQHTGSTDPLTEGWAFSSTAAGSFQGGTEVIGSSLFNYWETQDTSTSDFRAYVISLPSNIRDNDWSLSAQVRVISSPPAFSGTTAGGQSIAVSDGITVWQFNFRDDRAGPVGPFPFNLVTPALLNTVSTYHLYRIDFQTNLPGTADDTASFFIDGNLVISNVARSQLAGASGTSQILFGNASSPGTSTARYSSVVLSAVPEPSAFALLLIGLGAIGLIAKRRQPSLS